MLSLIELSGDPFQIGKVLGRFGAEATHRHLIASAAWDSVMRWRDTRQAHAMKALVEQRFPAVHQELQGLAAGLELDPDDVFLWNCRGDVWAMAPDGCTTVQLPSHSGPRISHNEDGDPGFAGYCGIGEFIPKAGARFASFVYPASIPGHAFAVTASGLVMTVNNIRARGVVAGVPRMVLTRAMLNEPTITDAIVLLRDAPRAGGFHLSLAQRGQTDLISIEFSGAGMSVEHVRTPSVHANHAIHPAMNGLAQVVTESSRLRQQRGEALLAVAQQGENARGNENRVDPLVILADQHNREFPIFRDSPTDSDNENTMATADIHVGADHVTWQVYERAGLERVGASADAQDALALQSGEQPSPGVAEEASAASPVRPASRLARFHLIDARVV